MLFFRVEPLELEALLIEVTVISTRVDLYLRFLRKKLMADFAAIDKTNKEKEGEA